MKKISQFLLFCLVFLNLIVFQNTSQAQNKKNKKTKPAYHSWEFGPSVGFALAQTDMVNLSLKEAHPGGAIALRKNLSKSFAIRANIITAKISGDDANTDKHKIRGFSFESPLKEATLIAEYDFLGKKRYKDNGFYKIWSPYVGLGVGLTYTKPTTNYNLAQNLQQATNIQADIANKKDQFISMPMVFGVKRDISEKMRFYTEVGLRYIFNDYLDGVSKSGNPDRNDTYIFGSIGMTFVIGAKKDSDNDGVPDKEDACPNIAGLIQFKGCPDTDGDGIEDKKDQCPNEAGTTDMKGCPDTDGDGITDAKDECPTEKGLDKFKGCPDTDGDGIADKNDNCPTEKGLIDRKGCPIRDADGDGIEDDKDNCPNEKGTLADKGCPAKILDTDGDGIIDTEDLCPDKAGIAQFNGCPDSDGDGVEDAKDNCPTEKGTITNAGCPELKKEDQQILQDARYGVQFETGSAVLKTTSYAVLDKVSEVMTKYPSYMLDISGHTDNTGNEAANKKLSTARAKACYDYLTKKGVVNNRMNALGFGSAVPVATNSTADGRAKNRRVEFNLKAK